MHVHLFLKTTKSSKQSQQLFCNAGDFSQAFQNYGKTRNASNKGKSKLEENPDHHIWYGAFFELYYFFFKHNLIYLP